jgi:hypothetical protein
VTLINFEEQDKNFSFDFPANEAKVTNIRYVLVFLLLYFSSGFFIYFSSPVHIYISSWPSDEYK